MTGVAPASNLLWDPARNAHLILEEGPVPAPQKAPVEASESTGGAAVDGAVGDFGEIRLKALTAQAGRL